MVRKETITAGPVREALFYEKIDNDRVRCHLCAHNCAIPDGKKGACNVRQNMEGVLYTLVYGHTIARHSDPIEKKSLFHFHPGSISYSIAAPGCSFRCRWCQNWDISQMPREHQLEIGSLAAPEEIVSAAVESRCQSIAYTYTEPTIFFEYAYDIARLAHQVELANVFVTNGYMTAEVLDMILPYLDAANVDLKSFRKKTYHRFIGGSLQPILDNMKRLKQSGVWLEITTLLVPDINDDPAELRDMARFIAEELGRDTPWHISRFFPAYKLIDLPPTPVRTLLEARETGLEAGLDHVYMGNVPDEGYQDTVCPSCGHTLIRRGGYWIISNLIRDGRCLFCGTPVAGVWSNTYCG